MNTEPTYREAFSSEPDRKPQGFYIDQMKSHANIEIAEEDAARMRCSSFREFDFVCRNITATTGIRKDRVYPSLRMIGYNWCYHDLKSNMGDVFSEIEERIRTSDMVLNYDAMMQSETPRDFITTKMYRRVYRVTKPVREVALKQAEPCKIKTSDLNLYHAMSGLKVLIDNEPDFILLRENEIVEDVMRVLRRSERSLLAYLSELRKLGE
jgi:hypothetical protein